MNFNKIIEENKNNVKKIIRLVTGEVNEDIEQETYIKAWKNSDKYKENGNMKGWLGTIAKNLSKDYLKTAKVNYETKPTEDNEIFEQIQDKKSSPENAFIIRQRQIQTTKAINSLKPKFKEVIIMYELEGLSYEEISKKLNCPTGTIKSRLYNAKKELYEKLKDVI